MSNVCQIRTKHALVVHKSLLCKSEVRLKALDPNFVYSHLSSIEYCSFKIPFYLYVNEI